MVFSTVLRYVRLFFYYLYFLFLFNVIPIFALLLYPICGARRTYHGCINFIVHILLKSDINLIGSRASEVETFNGIILLSHKSHLDFLLGFVFGDACTLGRLLVAVACPFMFLCGILSKTLIVFNRASKKSRKIPLRERFAKALAQRGRLIIFPEGHRLPIRGTLSPLRTGSIAYAFDQDIPILVAPCEGAQTVMNYSLGKIRRNMPIVINCKEVVNPADFAEIEEFIEYIEHLFKEGYSEACNEFDSIVGKRYPEINIEQIVNESKDHLDTAKLSKQKIH
ncbi:hypothetical protein P9112_014057 [Eukaryota sp. TZLM1-RC]